MPAHIEFFNPHGLLHPPAPRSNWSMAQFHLERKLGKGYASTVYLAEDYLTGAALALKVYHKMQMSELNHFQVQREIRLHAALDHPNIIKLVSGRGCFVHHWDQNKSN